MDRITIIKYWLNLPRGLDQIIIKYDYYVDGLVDNEINIPEGIKTFKVLKDGRIFIATIDDSFILLDGNIKYTIENKVGQVTKMIVLPDNRIAILSHLDIIGIINPDTKNYDTIFKEHHHPIFYNQLYVINQNEDKYDMLSIDNQYIIIWDPNTGQIKNSIRIPRKYHFLSRISENEIMLGRKGYIEFYNLTTNKIGSKIYIKSEDIVYGKLLPDGKIWSISDKFTINIYNPATKQSKRLYQFKSLIIIHPLSDNYIIIEDFDEEGNVYFWNIETLNCDYIYSHKKGSVNSSIVLPDNRIAVSINNQILIFDLSLSTIPPFIITAPFYKIMIDLLPNGKVILSSNEEALITLK